MTTNYHTPIAAGEDATPATFNLRYGELDAAIGAIGSPALDDLSDVTVTTPADNDLLAYDTGSAEWINQNAAAAGVAAAVHTHAASDVTSGIFPLERGGTESDLSATGPGAVVQASAGAALTVESALDEVRGGTGQTGYTKGDLLVATASGTLVKLSVGANDQVLTADSAEASGIKWATGGGGASTTTEYLNVVFGNGSSAIAANEQVWLVVPAGTITEAWALADQSGSIVVDVWKDTYANYPPTDADSITGSAPITISSAIKSQDTTLTGWTTTLSAGDILLFNVDSASTVTQVTITLKITKTL
jgi:hypothetical protein